MKDLIETLELAEAFLPILERIEKTFLKIKDNIQITSDCGKYHITMAKESRFSFSKHGNGYDYMGLTVEYQNIYHHNNFNTNFITFSPLNKYCMVHANKTYKLDENYQYSEAKYFQCWTLDDLPPKEEYIAVQNFIEKLWKGQYVMLELGGKFLTPKNLENFKILLEKVEEYNV